MIGTTGNFTAAACFDAAAGGEPWHGPLRIFRNELLEGLQLNFYSKAPVRPLRTQEDILYLVCARILIGVVQFRIVSRYASNHAPVQIDHSDSFREGCAVTSITVNADTRDWRNALACVVQELRAVCDYGITDSEQKRYMEAMLKDVEKGVVENDTVPSEDHLNFIMTSDVFDHVVMHPDQSFQVYKEVAPYVTKEQIITTAKWMFGFLAYYGKALGVPLSRGVGRTWRDEVQGAGVDGRSLEKLGLSPVARWHGAWATAEVSTEALPRTVVESAVEAPTRMAAESAVEVWACLAARGRHAGNSGLDRGGDRLGGAAVELRARAAVWQTRPQRARRAGWSIVELGAEGRLQRQTAAGAIPLLIQVAPPSRRSARPPPQGFASPGTCLPSTVRRGGRANVCLGRGSAAVPAGSACDAGGERPQRGDHGNGVESSSRRCTCFATTAPCAACPVQATTSSSTGCSSSSTSSTPSKIVLLIGLLGILINVASSAEPLGFRPMTPQRGQRIGESRLPAPQWGQPHEQNVQGLPAAELAQQSTSKVPPFWAPYLEQRGYPFRLWVQDVMLWCAATELQQHQRGPAIVQRLGGTARDLCREVPVEAIAHGRFDQLGNLVEDGVQMLITGLRRRFGPLDVQSSISTIVELLTFRRQERESVDDAITRFEALRARVAQLDDPFVLPTPVLALLFLEALHVPKAVYPLVLQANSGQLPLTLDQLNSVIGMVRQQGHFAEHTHAGPQNLAEGYRGKGYHGHHWFTGESDSGANTWNDTAAYMYGQNAAGAAGSAGSTSQHYVVQDDEGYDCCAVCSSYLYEDEPGDEDSMTDDDDLDISQFTQEELQEYYGDSEGWDYDTLLHEYLFAKRRFRHFVQRNSRRSRFPRSNWSLRMSSGKGGSSFGRGRGHGKGYHFGGSVVNPGSLAGGKGKKKKGGKHYMAGTPGATNPRGRDGRTMRCHECDSETHLVAACPKRKGKGKGKHFMSWNAGSAATGTQQAGAPAADPTLAAYAPVPTQPRTGALSGVLHWFTEDARTPGLQIDDLDEDTFREALSWETLDMRDNVAEHDILTEIQASMQDRAVEEQPPVTAGRSAAVTSPTWFPWWRVDQFENAGGETYLVRTRMKDRSGEALLVDPGSPGNLTGDEWGNRMAARQQQAGRPPPVRTPLDRVLEVGGVGSGSQQATHAHRYQLALQGGQAATYEAPVLPNSSVPALLGRASLRDQRILLDCFNNRMYRIGPGGYSLQLSPGSSQYHLDDGIGDFDDIRSDVLARSDRADSRIYQDGEQEDHHCDANRQREVQGRPPSAWVFGDLQNLCQNALHGCGYAPELVWISLAQPGTSRGTRNDKRAKRFECKIARAQLEGHRCCIVEADEGSAVWDMPDILELLDDRRWHAGERRRPGRVSFADDVDETGCKVSALTASFPTEQRTRDKARKAADPERKVKKRPQTVEQVFDDCGSDFTKLYVANEYELDEVCYGTELREDQYIDEQPYIMMSEFFGMIGSEAHLNEKDEQQNFFSSVKDMDTYMNLYYGHLQHDDVAELCGGASGTTRLLVRRGYRGGPNFDLICDCNLMTHEGQRQFWEYLYHRKPLVLLISTPCTSLKGFSALNRVINYDGWLRSRKTSVGLARIAAAAACTQMDAGRHFASEQPLGSDFYKLDDWQYIANNYAVVWCQVDQCMAGKIGRRTGLPIKKSSEFWASDERLIAGLRKFRCDGQHDHALLAHGGRGPHPERDEWRLENPKDHAEWAIGICRELAASISQMVERVRYQGHHLVVYECYPTDVGIIGRLTIHPTIEGTAGEAEPDEASGGASGSADAIGEAPVAEQPAAAPAARARGVDAGTQARGSDEPGWTAFDLGHALRLLHSPHQEVVRRQLRRLHVRFWHAPAARLRELLTKAGAPASTLALVKEICDTCRVCRLWTRPGPKSMTISRLATGFNEMVQWDILYIGEQMVAHMIDEATRWTVLHILDRKTAIMIIAGITQGWLRPHGPMKLLIADIEGGLHGEEAYQWLDRWGIEMKAKEEGSHAQLVERHHDLVRKIIHRVQAQLAEEGIVMPLEIVIMECALIKNLLITVAGYSPYQAVYGRLPPLLAEFEPVSDCQIDDQSAGIPGISRHHHRLREVAMQAMVEMTAKDRLRRALRSKTRAPHEALQLVVGDQVDFHRPPSTKEESGWRGPATLLQVGPPVLIRWQGRVFQVRPQDLRRSLVYFVMFTNNIFFEAGSRDPVATIMSYADQLDSKVVRVGWLFDAGWKRTADSQKLSELVLAVLHVAASGFYLVGCIGARVGNGVSVLEGMVGCDHSFLWWWRRGRPELSWYHEASGSARLKLAPIFGKEHWRDVSFVQFIMTDDESVRELRRREPEAGVLERDRAHVMARIVIMEPEVQEYSFASWQHMREQAALPAVDTECAQSDFFFAAPDADHVAEAVEDDSSNSRPDCVEIGIGAPLMYWVYPEVEHTRRPGAGEIYVLRVYNTGKREIVVEREMNVLTLEEARAHEVEVRQAMKDELQRWAELKAFQRFPKDQATNIIDSRWVLKWKEIDGKKQVTAQRKWRLFSADISQAFLRGLTFEQVAAMDGEVKRKVQFTMPPGSIPVLRQLEGYEDYNPVTEVLLLLRCGFGLKDAPRLWQVMLKQVLEKTGGKALISDPQIYVYHDAKGELQMIMSSHVDDLKGGGEDHLREKVLSMIESEFGKLKRQYDCFECIGIMHEQDPVTKAIWTHQQHYVQQLRPLQEDQYVMENEDGQVSVESHAAYMSLLGGSAWMTQTMAPIAVYVSYLQRQAKKPAVGDIRKINRLLKWIMVNAKQLGVRFIELDMTRVRLAVVSDSAFHAMEFEGLAIRGCVIMLLEADDEVLQTGTTYRIVMLDWYSRKQNNVVRSTYAAELMALLDALGTGTLMNVAMTEISEGVCTANQMRVRQEAGDLVLKMIAAIDAKAVFDAISADTIKVTTDKRMFVPTLAAREQIDRLQLAQLSWIDTLDMLADGLTKGELDRTALVKLGFSSEWHLSGLQPVAFSVRSVP
ncbi:unnamed protein product [Prorocentrum cordatum]|uniref:Integrase catalytic domain-containing protein n=1 Tax=Prorocentrum cordatum TaxID=2364126 RepID=A0ABN9Q554_9DINO|nr:unnamed protein product [Polarella glacialis]